MLSQMLIALPAAFLGVAGLGKILDPQRFAASLAGFGLPAWSWVHVRRGVPVAECSLAIALIVPATRPFAVGLALLLLGVFSLLLALAWRRRSSFRCECLGLAVGGEPAGLALARNALLLVSLAGAAFLGAVETPSPSTVLVALQVVACYLLGSSIREVRHRRAILVGAATPEGHP